ncbi:hypothetical protein COY87_02385 [Candidatus Roizmanbacteria bacterium CG_4_10_14_0_8_um_filter_33_9]|uniref:Nucleotidyl transferase domain-containing protein n=1 Tax=Candidatus Roizmanbacteria bacterium CG_4_10_14_0_8_um_filter_33_9 TaxID=1974826 RepID=A0A2M7QJH9_9BACT|nr:MAG: hypothetical protein COY87_02385 [Candidatus Roizmanbacteria bacterium CG_4_10_14_0_8_um_filter_33_9]
MKPTVYGIILAGGNGSRMKLQGVNKVTSEFKNKPLIYYGVELLNGIVEKTVIVIGAYAESVKKCLQSYQVEYVVQKERLGTAHATQCGLNILPHDSSSIIIVGYGDHMMYYQKKTIQKLIQNHIDDKVELTFVTSYYDDINSLAYGRILRDKKGCLIGIIEQKDASEKEKNITEFNAGLYCFNYTFLKESLPKIKLSPISHEYYLTDLIKLGIQEGKKVYVYKVPFHEVGVGINRQEDFLLNNI